MSQMDSDLQALLQAAAGASSVKGVPRAAITPATSIGHSAPLGSTVCEGGVNFSVFSRKATGVELLFFDREDDARPQRVISIDPAKNHTYHYWHVFVPA